MCWFIWLNFGGKPMTVQRAVILLLTGAFLTLSGGAVNAQAPSDAMIPDTEAKREASQRADDDSWGWLGLLGLLGLGGLAGRRDLVPGARRVDRM
jgi:MYXO-CTERM domain-containing protein